MRKIINILFILLFVGLTSCTDSSNGPKVTFSNSVYRLSAEEPLNVTITSTKALERDLTVSFTVSGTAKQDSDYTISSTQVIIKAGTSAGIVTITPEGNYDDSKNIILRLESSSEYKFGPNMVTSIAVQQKEKLITSFTQDNYLVKDTVEVEMNFKGYNDEYAYTSLSEIHIPFTIDTENSTAVQDINFTIIDNATEFVVAPGKHTATIKIVYKNVDGKVDKDHNIVFLKISKFADNIIIGTYEETKITILGPTKESALYGKWVFESEDNRTEFDYLGVDDIANLPKPTTADTLEFFIDDDDNSVFLPHLKSGLKNFFMRTNYVYDYESIIHLAYPDVLNVSYMKFEQANYLFSENEEKIQNALVGFDVSEDKKSMTLIINDFIPTDFFTVLADYGMVTDTPPILPYSLLKYTFKKVEE